MTCRLRRRLKKGFFFFFFICEFAVFLTVLDAPRPAPGEHEEEPPGERRLLGELVLWPAAAGEAPEGRPAVGQGLAARAAVAVTPL